MPTTHENPYNPFEETGCYRAYQQGREARGKNRPITTLPYPLSENREALAWLDGWTTQSQPSTAKDERETA